MLNRAEGPSWHGTDVDVTSIERHLSNLWKQLPVGSGNISAVRTHIFNLVAYAANQSQMDHVIRLSEMAQRHPSRSIVLRANRSSGQPTLDASVSLHCRSGSDGSPSYCHEEIVLGVHGRAADHLASIVIPLLQPEIATYLWWPGQPLFGHRLFHHLLAAADQIIVDSAQFASPADGLAALASLCNGRISVNDFNWARLTPWREIIAQFFDSPSARQYLLGIRSIRVEFGAGMEDHASLMSGVLLILGWLASLLGWEPETTLDAPPAGDITMSVLQGERLIMVDLMFRDHGHQAAGKLMGLELLAQLPNRPPARFVVRRDDRLHHVMATVEIHDQCSVTRVVPLGIKSDDQLLSEELELAGQDTLYSTVVRRATALAGREAWVT